MDEVEWMWGICIKEAKDGIAQGGEWEAFWTWQLGECEKSLSEWKKHRGKESEPAPPAEGAQLSMF